MRMPVFVGVDGGATMTRSVIAGQDFSLLGRAITGSSNPQRRGVDDALREISEAISSAADAGGVGAEDLQATCVGLAGVRRWNLADILARGLEERLKGGRVIVETDALIAFRAAIPDGYGVILIAGTGSVAFGMSEEGVSHYSDGLGPFLGDEGSAYWIGREGLRAVARELDGRGSPTGFTNMVLSGLDAEDLDGLSEQQREGSLDVTRIASLAPIVIRAFLEDSGEAERILKEAASLLVRSIRSVAGKLGIIEEDFPVALCGGLFHADSILKKQVRDLIFSTLPRARVMEPFLPPEYGALAIAMSAEGLGNVKECLIRLKENNPPPP
jgi:N-acetylglucosamine kinase-like BadF-type ATPase